MKHKKTVIVLILLFGLIISIIYILTRKVNIRELEEQITHLEYSNNLLRYSLSQSIIYGKDTINSTIKTSDGIVPLSKIIDMNTIVFRFSEHSCTPCLKRELSNISRIEKRGIPLLIIASYSNKRELRILLEKYNIRSRYLLLDEKQSLFTFEDSSSDLYFFLLKPSLKINYLFFPVQTDDSLSSEYFNFIEAIYLKNRN